MKTKLTVQERFKRDLNKLLQRYGAILELTDYESERNYSMWVFLRGKTPIDLGRKQPNNE